MCTNNYEKSVYGKIARAEFACIYKLVHPTHTYFTSEANLSTRFEKRTSVEHFVYHNGFKT